jgi:hypothetical protein
MLTISATNAMPEQKGEAERGAAAVRTAAEPSQPAHSASCATT